MALEIKMIADQYEDLPVKPADLVKVIWSI